jgi:hypothetical protein
MLRCLRNMAASWASEHWLASWLGARASRAARVCLTLAWLVGCTETARRDEPPLPPQAAEATRPRGHAFPPLPGPERELSSLPPQLKARVGEPELERMRAWLENRCPFKSVVTSYVHGSDVIDCMDKWSQPSLRDHPRHAPLPSAPTSFPGGPDATTSPLPMPERVPCPQDTVPVRRISLLQLAEAGSVLKFEGPPP